jgi:short-chain 2-methylacyl-CoA dehydrogenase
MSLRASTQPLTRALRSSNVGGAVRTLATTTTTKNGVLIPSSAAPSSSSSALPTSAENLKAGIRQFSSSRAARFASEASGDFASPFGINSLSKFTEEEEMLRETVRRFAQDVVQPKVMEMDETELMDKGIIKDLFDQGLMGIETSADHNGADCSFTAAIIVIEGA